MKYSILFLIILIGVSGFIAYWGDLLGRRMGKRRLTLFGLRPKHTAIIVTSITGSVIAALTLATMLTVDSRLRQLLVRGDQIISDNRELGKRNEALKGDLGELTNRLNDTIDKVQQANEAVAEANRSKMLAEEKAQEQARKVERQTRRLAEIEKDYATTLDRLRTREQRLASTTSLLREVDDAYKKAQHDADTFGASYEDMVERKVIAEQSEEIVRGVIRPSPRARVDLLNLLDQASEIMRGRGAAKPGGKRAVAVVPILVKARSGQPIARSEEDDTINALARSIAKNSMDVVVLVKAFSNCVEGKQAPVMIVSYNNKVAFRKGDGIASASFDGNAPHGRLLNELIRFMQTDVRKAARQADVIARTDPDDPQAMFGTIAIDGLMEIVNRIKAENSQVRVRVVAREDITAAGPMDLSNLDFVISGRSANARPD